MNRALLIANFGGPRNLSEVKPFLKELLCDQDVIQTGLPSFIHRFIFSKVAQKRAANTAEDYKLIGGKSPIFFDTEAFASYFSNSTFSHVITFHRYLPMTHKESLQKLIQANFDEVIVFPLFPQFTYATTGSLARFFNDRLPKKIIEKFKWIRAYGDSPLFVQSYQNVITDFLKTRNLKEEETLFIYSAHGIPKKYVDQEDPYEKECLTSFNLIKEPFKKASHLLSFQSKFGKGEWLRPYTSEVTENIYDYLDNKKQVALVPISFTSDHIETLFEVEEQYIAPIKESNIQAYRVEALNLRPDWLKHAALIISQQSLFYTTKALIRKN